MLYMVYFIYMPYNLAFLFLDVFPKQMKVCVHTKTCT